MANNPHPIPPIESTFPSPTQDMEPPLPPFPPNLLPNLPSINPPLPPHGPNNPFPKLTHEMYCEHCQRTQALIDNFQGEMRFILDRLNPVLSDNKPVPFKEQNRPADFCAPLKGELTNYSRIGKTRMGKGLLGPNNRSGGLIEGRFGEKCGGNGRRGGSMSGVGEGKRNSCRGWKFSEGVKKGLRTVGAGGGEVNGGGVDLGVSKRLLLEVAGEMIGESGGIEVGEVGGGADT
ncbi:hypothetical protein Tco_0916039 [Tanacetum coccineum]